MIAGMLTKSFRYENKDFQLLKCENTDVNISRLPVYDVCLHELCLYWLKYTTHNLLDSHGKYYSLEDLNEEENEIEEEGENDETEGAEDKEEQGKAKEEEEEENGDTEADS